MESDKIKTFIPLTDGGRFLSEDSDYARGCHYRWVQQRNRKMKDGEEDPPDEWILNQCERCRYYIRLTGQMKTDWGVCSNSSSVFDGRVRFEHDGCEFFSSAYDD